MDVYGIMISALTGLTRPESERRAIIFGRSVNEPQRLDGFPPHLGWYILGL